MFVLKERVVYPGHGVAQITGIIEKKISGASPVLFFELTFLNKHMIVLVPVAGVITAGIRRLSSEKVLGDVLTLLGEPTRVMVSDQVQMNWNKKNKKIQEEIRTGDLRAICVLYRDLLARMVREKRGLSYGEQELLKKTEGLLVEEIAVVYEITIDKAEGILRSHLRQEKAPQGVYQAAIRCEDKP